MATKKRRISRAESAELVGVVKEVNSLAKDFLGIFKKRVDDKEKHISVLVSKIKSPKRGGGLVDVTNVDMNSDFIKSMRKRKRGLGSSEWDETFSSKKGWII